MNVFLQIPVTGFRLTLKGRLAICTDTIPKGTLTVTSTNIPSTAAAHDGTAARAAPTIDYETPLGSRQTAWVGWSYFAAILLMVGGGFAATFGLVAVIDGNWSGWQNVHHVAFATSTYGWMQIVVGTIVFLSGLGVLTGNVIARTVAVIIAAVSLVGNFFAIPLYPFWAIAIIVVDLLVIWALTVHGREMKMNKEEY